MRRGIIVYFCTQQMEELTLTSSQSTNEIANLIFTYTYGSDLIFHTFISLDIGLILFQLSPVCMIMYVNFQYSLFLCTCTYTPNIQSE